MEKCVLKNRSKKRRHKREWKGFWSSTNLQGLAALLLALSPYVLYVLPLQMMHVTMELRLDLPIERMPTIDGQTVTADLGAVSQPLL
jgi:hypothetical protein